MSIFNDPIDYDEYAPAENSYTMSCDNCSDELNGSYGFVLFEEMLLWQACLTASAGFR